MTLEPWITGGHKLEGGGGGWFERGDPRPLFKPWTFLDPKIQKHIFGKSVYLDFSEMLCDSRYSKGSKNDLDLY